jgi:MFS family permease
MWTILGNACPCGFGIRYKHYHGKLASAPTPAKSSLPPSMSLTDPAPDSLLRHRAFVLFWSARVSSAFAFQMVGVAMGWQMYALTGSALDLGLVGLVQFLPATVLILIAGQLADRYDRRRIAQVSQLVEGCAAAALAYGAFTGTTSKDLILVAAFFLGAGRAGESPTMQTLLPAVVPTALFPRAVAASSAAQQVATITGPAVGGIIYALNPTAVYSICFVMFAAAAAQLAFLRYERAISRLPVTLTGFFAGISYIRRNPILLGILTLDLFAVLLGGAMALLPIFAKDVFDVGPIGLGILRAAPAVGALLITASLTRWSFNRNVGRIEFITVALFGVATIVFASTGSFWLAWFALAVMGGADAISVVIRLTLLQLETPDDMRGRVSAVNSLFVSMSNQIGDFRAGVVAALIGAVPAVLVGGIGTLLTVLLCMRLFPELYRVEGFHDKRAP